MHTAKSSLAMAQPTEMGSAITFCTTRAENCKLNAHVRNYGKDEHRLREGESELVAAIWSRAVGLAMPLALTVQAPGYDAYSMVATHLELHYCRFDFDWHIVLRGINLRQTGATGNRFECIELPLRRPVAMAKRELNGTWRPVSLPVQEESIC